MEIISRNAAIISGKKRFYTGRLCKRGHDCERFVKNGACVRCVNSWRDRMAPADTVAAMHITVPVPPGLTADQMSRLSHWLQNDCVPFFIKNLESLK